MSPPRARVLQGLHGSDPAVALRAHLVAVTQRLLAAHGLAGLTTRAIAREAEVSDGVLYNHFADKDELVMTALVEQVATLGADFRAALPEAGSGTLRENLETVGAAAVTFQSGLLPLVGGLLGRADLVERFFVEVHTAEDSPQQLLAAVADLLRAEQQLGRVRADVDLDAAVDLLFGACQVRAIARQVAGHVPGAASPGRQDLAPVVGLLADALEP